ncbi:MAG TPA: signal recognition particle protein [Myxococcaceae bacterium]|nr:signal recognition particle protein [Myxococcaceae bacterium]
MLETVTKGFRAAKNRLAGKQEITPELVDESLRDIRVSLLEADVAFDVVKSFVARVREKAVGATVQTTITDKQGRKHKVSPGDHFIKVCHDELEALMGPVDTSLRFKPKGGVTTMMMVGLQGSGKTTTAGKLASYLQRKGRKPLLVAADIYRPAAVDQLQVLGQRLGVPVFFQPDTLPPDLAVKGVEAARAQRCDVVLVDTAGRLAIDEQLMNELNLIKAAVQPDDILLVVDAMIGQDAVRTAAEFDRRLSLDGFILTKLDGDARGGAALSIKEVTGKPIKFLGLGESLDKLEEFRPDGLASRILGFGDIVGLMQDFEQVVDEKKAEEDAKKLLSGNFSMKDFVEQIRTVRKMGPLKDLLEKFPIFGEMTEQLNPDEKELTKIEAMYDSMTEAERLRPSLINEGRMARIARGSGRKKKEVQELLGKHQMMQQVMGAVGQNPGLLGRIPGFKQLGQLSKMKNMDLSQVFGKDAKMMEQALGGGGMPMQIPQVAPGYTPPMGAGAMARARLMGYSDAPMGKQVDRDALKDRRKRERQARKKNRKRR